MTITADGQRASVALSYNAIPRFNYTGNYQIVDDAGNPITFTKGNWKVRFLTSGTLTMLDERSVDIFLCGGGGGGGNLHGGGGGGGYTKTERGVQIEQTTYAVTVGAGGASQSAGGKSSFGTFEVNGGNGGGQGINEPKTYYGADGGSGGSGGGKGAWDYGPNNTNGWERYRDNHSGAVDGANANNGKGQGTTTREFGEANATLYAGGGNGGADRAGASSGSANLGGGGGGGSVYGVGSSGYSGIVIIRNAR